MGKGGRNAAKSVPYIVFNGSDGQKTCVPMPMTVPAMKKKIAELLRRDAEQKNASTENVPQKYTEERLKDCGNRFFHAKNADVSDFLASIYVDGDGRPQNSYGNIIFFSGGKNYCEDVASARNHIIKEGCMPIPYGVGQMDAMYSPNVFIKKRFSRPRSCYEDILSVKAFAVDVDYNNMNDARLSDFLKRGMTNEARAWVKRESPSEYFGRMVSDGIFDDFTGGGLPVPMPNYIEYSHNIRFIYVLSDPIKCRIPSGERLLAAVRRIQERIVRKINEWDFEASAEIQEVTKYFRVPGSVNKKDGSVVCLRKAMGGTYDIRELLSEYMDDLPAWYGKWRSGKDSADMAAEENHMCRVSRAADRMRQILGGGINITDADGNDISAADLSRFSISGRTMPPSPQKKHRPQKKPAAMYCGSVEKTILKDRIERILQRRSAAPIKNRELLCFVYGATYQELHPDDDVVGAILDFNKNLPSPLSENEIKSKFRTLHKHTYLFRESTFCRLADIEERSPLFAAPAGRQKDCCPSDAHRAKYHNNEKWDVFTTLTSMGMKRADIASVMGISVSGVDYYRRQLKKRTAQTEKKSVNMLGSAVKFLASINTDSGNVDSKKVVVFAPSICILLPMADSDGGDSHCLNAGNARLICQRRLLHRNSPPL